MLTRLLLLSRYVAFSALCKTLIVVLLAGPAAAQQLKLVAIGDSLTHGFGLPPAEGFVPQLQTWLEEQGQDVDVINMGVSGDTTEGGRARLGWALADGADAVIIWLGGNDLLRGIDPVRSRDNLGAMAAEVSAQDLGLLIVGMQAPLNYGPEFKEAFDAMYGEVAKDSGAVLASGVFEGLVGAADLMQSDGIHPNKDGVARIVSVIGPKVLELLASLPK